MESYNQHSLNNNISEMFDNVMSDNINPIGGTNIANLKFNSNLSENSTQIPQQISHQIPQQISHQIPQQIPQQNPLQFTQQTRRQKQNKRRYKHLDLTKKIEMFDISKKAIIGSGIYILLSLPFLTILFNKLISTNIPLNFYKILIFKALLFSVIFVLISRCV